MSYKKICHLFDRIKPYKKNNEIHLHKPLLLLYALGKCAKSMPRLIQFYVIDKELKELFSEFYPFGNIAANTHYPFGRLENDRLWVVEDSPNLRRTSVGHLIKSELIQKNIKGGFIKEVYDALAEDKNLILECARLLLYKYFPVEQHQAILDFIELEDPGKPSMIETAVIQELQIHYQASCRYQGVVLTSRFLPDLQQISTELPRFFEDYEYWQEPGIKSAPDSSCKGRFFCDKAFHQERNGLIILEPENWLFEWPREERKGFWSQLGNHYGRYPVIILARDVDFTTSDLSNYFKVSSTALNNYRFWTSKYQLS